MGIQVVKRDGTKTDFDIQKIKEQINKACSGVAVNPLELEAKVSLSVKNNIKTSEIQELLVNTAVAMVSVEAPEWSLVAGRLAMHQLHREVYKNTKIEKTDFRGFLQYVKRNDLYRKDFLSVFSDSDLQLLEKEFREEYDFSQNIAQVALLKSKYLIKGKKGVVEYPQFADMSSAMVLASKEEKPTSVAKEYFEMLSKMYISLATSFKLNLRRESGNTGSCFIAPVGDNLNSITKVWHDAASISKEGGGAGLYLGKLRPQGAYSLNIPKANAITRWTKIFNDIAIAINQRGIRKGAFTVAVDWWRPDIHGFIEMKTETGGDLRDKCFDLFPQVVVDDYFVEAVMQDKDVWLFDHFEFKQKTGIDVTDLVFEDLYVAISKANAMAEAGQLKNAYNIKAKDLWKEFLRIWVETGDFYIVHKDNLNLANMLSPEYIANCANLCIESFSIGKVASNYTTRVRDDNVIFAESDGLYHACSLISINVGIIHSDELLERVCKNAVRMLDASIDLGKMPVVEAQNASDWLRNIGIGTVGVADWMAYNELSYDKPEDLDELEKLFEKIAYYCYNASITLAEEKGAYPAFKPELYTKLFGKTPKELDKESLNGFKWSGLIDKIQQKGIRNFLINAVAPNTSTGVLMGSSASYLPVHSKLNYQTLSNLTVPIVPRYIKDKFWYYRAKYQYPAHKMIEATFRVQKWVDTGVSMEVFINPDLTSFKDISDTILFGFKTRQLKGVYYSVTIDAKKEGCTDCEN